MSQRFLIVFLPLNIRWLGKTLTLLHCRDNRLKEALWQKILIFMHYRLHGLTCLSVNETGRTLWLSVDH